MGLLPSLEDDNMPERPKITSYRALPPKARILYSESDRPMTPGRYLGGLDAVARAEYEPEPGDAQRENVQGCSGDLASQVLRSRLEEQRIGLLHNAAILLERHALADRHLRQLRDERSRLRERLPFRGVRGVGIGFYDDHQLTDVEKTILDLERQERTVETKLWSDLLELRQTLSEKRGEYRSLHDRHRYLSGINFGSGADATRRDAALVYHDEDSGGGGELGPNG
jgi:hypothetical protein